MDSELHHDPFAPEGANAMTDFNIERWDRAGATAEELAVLRVEHDALPAPEQAAMNGWVASLSDGGLRVYLDGRREAEPDGFVAAVEQPLTSEGGVPPVQAPSEDPTPLADRGEPLDDAEGDEETKKTSRGRSGHHS